jgi:dihydrofolate synthase/folylpolyglutamate synthase
MWTGQLLSPILRRKATFFEASTVLAFADFAARGVEIAVVEVGLGGRLDSTNVVNPLVSGITKIERDHMKYLGDTLESIAREKAGIAKPGVPFVIGERDRALVDVLRHEAKRAVKRAGGGFPADIRVLPPDYEWCGPLSLAGAHQRRNAAVAHGILAALPEPYRPTQEQIESGFGSARVPGRLDRRGRWLFDVAHNPDGIRALITALKTLRPSRPLHALVSILGDKDWSEMLVHLDQAIDKGVLTIAPTAAARGWDIDWLGRWLKDPNRPPAHAEWSLIADFREAIDKVQEGAGTVLVTGSFHTVGDVMVELGFEV